VDCTTSLKGLTVHCKEEQPDMYASIDAAAKALASKLGKYRTRRNEGYHGGNSMGQDLMDALTAMELDDAADEDAAVEADLMYSGADFIDASAPNLMKVNSYDLENAIPINEAIFALDYVDHDFFVFKNEETGKPSVVYKRNAGGIGLVEMP
jgi:putative sigma-54 modulation protein